MNNEQHNSGALNAPLTPGKARMANGGAPLERLGVRFHDCEAGWIEFTLGALSPEWRTRWTHLKDPFADMLRWLGEIVEGEGAAHWKIAEEGFATQFIYMPGNRNPHGHSCGVLIQTGSNETNLFYSWSCSVDSQRLVSEVYTAFRSFVESASYRPQEWEWNGVDEDDLPDLFDLDADAFKFYEARLPVWEGGPLRTLRSQRVEAFIEGRALTSHPMRQLSYEATRALVKVRAQLAAIERGVLPLAFFRGNPQHDTPRFDASGRPHSDGAYGPVWKRLWRAFELAGVMAPVKGGPTESNIHAQWPVDSDVCASLSWEEATRLLVSMRRRALAGQIEAPTLIEIRLLGAIAERILYLAL